MFSIDDWLLTQLFMWKKFDAKAKLKVRRKIVAAKEETKKAVLFFPYWTGESKIYRFLAHNLKEYTKVYYDYPKEIMSKNINVSLKYLRTILIDAFNLILELRKKGYNEIVLVGSSLGSNISLKLASMVKVDKIIINMIDRSLALEILKSSAMSMLRKKLQKDGLKLENLHKIYSFMATEPLLDNIKKTNAKILMFLSKNDIFCNLSEFQPVLKKMDKLNIDYELHINKCFGHILSIYKNLFLSRRIVRFIKEE
jgi:esterase/lipase